MRESRECFIYSRYTGLTERRGGGGASPYLHSLAAIFARICGNQYRFRDDREKQHCPSSPGDIFDKNKTHPDSMAVSRIKNRTTGQYFVFIRRQRERDSRTIVISCNMVDGVNARNKQ